MNISNFAGKTIEKVSYQEGEGDELVFKFTDGSEYKMYHPQDCCESVSLESWSQEDVKRLEGQKIVHAYESEQSGDFEYGTCTWTFYTIATEKDTAVLRWYGESNGYYSESVSIIEIAKPRKETPNRFNLMEDE